MFGELMLAAIAWATLSIVVSVLVSMGLMRWLGLPFKKLVHEIEDVQNTAVGACFFIVSLTTSLFISIYFSDGFSEPQAIENNALWFISGLIVSAIYVAVLMFIAHRAMGRLENETVYHYLRREIVEEQNAALAFFLGGLAVCPFIAVIFQII